MRTLSISTINIDNNRKVRCSTNRLRDCNDPDIIRDGVIHVKIGVCVGVGGFRYARHGLGRFMNAYWCMLIGLAFTHNGDLLYVPTKFGENPFQR
jgi:hypothetical protein